MRRLLLLACAVLAWGPASSGRAQTHPDLVSRGRLRVCAPPADLPFSNKAREGFENKIAAIIADELKLPLHFYWMPQGPGFVRATLGEDMCDVIIGYAADADIVDHSNPYYASTYVLLSRPGAGLEGVASLDDPRLAKIRLGVVAATPPADHLLRLGLIDKARVYALLVDRRFASPAEEAVADLEKGELDAVILWGPIGGFLAKKSSPPLDVAPLTASQRPALTFRIALGLRHNEPEWKHRLNDVLRVRKDDIDKVLRDSGVPLVAIDAAGAAKAGAADGDKAE